MPNGDAAYVAGKLKGDNRTVVGSKVKGAATAVVATSVGPNGSVLKNDAASPATLTAETASAAAYLSGITNDETTASVRGRTLVVPILPNTSGSPYDKRNLRTQFLWPGTAQGAGTGYDSSKAAFGAKRVYVNAAGSPLDANGVPTTVALAINAETTAITALGQAVSNGEQVYRTKDSDRAPWPGKYLSHPSQTSLYAPYAGWTAQQG